MWRKLSEFQWAVIADRRKNGETFQSIADEYGVSKQCIHQGLRSREIKTKKIEGQLSYE